MNRRKPLAVDGDESRSRSASSSTPPRNAPSTCTARATRPARSSRMPRRPRSPAPAELRRTRAGPRRRHHLAGACASTKLSVSGALRSKAVSSSVQRMGMVRMGCRSPFSGEVRRVWPELPHSSGVIWATAPLLITNGRASAERLRFSVKAAFVHVQEGEANPASRRSAPALTSPSNLRYSRAFPATHKRGRSDSFGCLYRLAAPCGCRFRRSIRSSSVSSRRSSVARVTVEDCLEMVGNRLVVILAAERARQLSKTPARCRVRQQARRDRAPRNRGQQGEVRREHQGGGGQLPRRAPHPRPGDGLPSPRLAAPRLAAAEVAPSPPAASPRPVHARRGGPLLRQSTARRHFVPASPRAVLRSLFAAGADGSSGMLSILIPRGSRRRRRAGLAAWRALSSITGSPPHAMSNAGERRPSGEEMLRRLLDCLPEDAPAEFVARPPGTQVVGYRVPASTPPAPCAPTSTPRSPPVATSPAGTKMRLRLTVHANPPRIVEQYAQPNEVQ